MSVTVLNCNYVLVHAVIEQGIGEREGRSLGLGEVWRDHKGEILCRDIVVFANISVVAGDFGQKIERRQFFSPNR